VKEREERREAERVRREREAERVRREREEESIRREREEERTRREREEERTRREREEERSRREREEEKKKECEPTLDDGIKLTPYFVINKNLFIFFCKISLFLLIENEEESIPQQFESMSNKLQICNWLVNNPDILSLANEMAAVSKKPLTQTPQTLMSPVDNVSSIMGKFFDWIGFYLN
jgi:hypothetical protein